MPVSHLDRSLEGAIRQKINQKIKLRGSIGRLEELALQIALIQKTLTPSLINPHILVFAGDHGITVEEASPYPAEFTYQMVQNFISGGAAINVFCKQNGLRLLVCDVGVNGTFAENTETFVKFKIRPGTRNMRHEPAMTRDECEAAIDAGRTLVNGVAFRACNVLGFGEMGIGNTSAASLLMHRLTSLPLENCVEKAAGRNDTHEARKLTLLEEVAGRYNTLSDPIDLLATMGGFEIAAITGGMLQAAENNMVILVDGFISTAALLVAHALEPAILDYCIFSHQSGEPGHRYMLDFLKARPLLDLGLRLGEGSGGALVFPIIDSAVQMLLELDSFE